MKNLDVLKSRYNSAVANVDKIIALIAKYEKRFEKRNPDFDILDYRAYSDKYDFWDWHKWDDIKERIAENNKKLLKAQEKVVELQKEIEEVEQEKAEIPEVLIDLMNKLIAYYDEIDSKDEKILKSEVDYHELNTRACEGIIKDLMFRCKAKIGKIIGHDFLYVQAGTHGLPVLNGFVEGEKGRAKIESIIAGGYNIQRKHIRVLVK